MSEPPELSLVLEDIKVLAPRAVESEQAGQAGQAAYLYRQTARLLHLAVSLGASQPGLGERAAQYLERAESLTLSEAGSSPQHVTREAGLSELSRAYNLLSEALELDEAGESDEALDQYKFAVEVCLETKKVVKTNKDLLDKLSRVAVQALERAESIRAEQDSEPQLSSIVPTHSKPNVRSIIKPLGDLDWGSDNPEGPGGTKPGFSEEEIKVLMITSRVNGKEYLPFIRADLLKERFAFPVPWTDPSGKLSLSPKQRQRLKSWCRPDEFIASPKMIEIVDCYSVKQTVVSDCSFVASIAIAAQYEKKYCKRLVTSIIYPQNKAGDPVYNPCGKYMVKLHINGVARKVVVDDYFPIGSYNEPLCSYSSNKSELWISLLEKAYMKVMGGYDFPGSNSNIDLYALTGWVPERVSIRPNDPTWDSEATFKNLATRLRAGQCLATVATGELSDALADRAGLVSTHAYAVLDAREVEGEKLLKLKNPWSHLRWRGNWSELDMRHWTPTYRHQLEYNPDDAANFDNGVFWIDYKSLQHYFDVLYMNWDPTMFRHSTVQHGGWSGDKGPAKDLITMEHNPQYRLEVRDAAGGGAVWLLLSRHITEISDFKNNKEYITLLIYKNDGKKVYYPHDPPPYIDGVRINSPHYLTKIILDKGENVRRFTVVVSQFEKTSTIYFTVKAFSTLPFKLDKIKTNWRHKEDVTGKWTSVTSGGCGNYRDTWPNNPRYKLELDSSGLVHIQLKGPKQYQIGFDVLNVTASDRNSEHYFTKKSSGLYRSGFVVLTVEAVAGVYDIIPSTFSPGQEGPFFLMVASSSSFKISKIR